MRQTSQNNRYQRLFFKIIYFLIFFFTVENSLIITKVTAQEAYAVLSTNKEKLTFYYDKSKENREGTKFEMNRDTVEPQWFSKNYRNTTITSVIFDKSFSEYKPQTCFLWFTNFIELKEIIGIENLNTEEVTNMAGMFWHCTNLKSVDVSNFNTSKVTDMTSMFDHCDCLTTIDVSNFDTKNVKSMGCMFFSCQSLTTLDLSSFDIRNVKYYEKEYPDGWPSRLKGEYKKLNEMFCECSNLKTIYVSDTWEIAKDKTKDETKEIYGMFNSCYKIEGGNGTIFNARNVDIRFARIDKPNNIGYFTAKYRIYYNGIDTKTNFPNAINYFFEDENPLLVNPTKDGYTFTGWTGSNGEKEEINVKITKNGNKSYTAHWKLNQYTVTLPPHFEFITDNTDGKFDYNSTVTFKIQEGYTLISDDITANNTIVTKNPDGTYSLIVPASDIIVNGIILAATDETGAIIAEATNETFCNGKAVINFTILNGEPQNYSIEFEGNQIPKQQGVINNNDENIEIDLPKNLKPGTYKGVLELSNNDDNASEKMPVILSIKLPYYSIIPLYNDVAAVNSLAGHFKAYQWTENSQIIAGANDRLLQYSFDKSATYTAILTFEDGSQYETCPLDMKKIISTQKTALKVYPNPAQSYNDVTIEVSENYIPDVDKQIKIYTLNGSLVKQVNSPKEVNKIQLPAGNYSGVYFQNGEKVSFKLIVK